jgi:hypothetical protein
MMEGSGSVQIMTDPDGPKTYIRIHNTGKKSNIPALFLTKLPNQHRNTLNDIEIHIV